MTALEPFMSLAGFGERIGRHYHGTDFALVDQLADFGELSGVGVGSVTDTARFVLHRLLSRWLAERGDDKATRLQRRPGPFLGFSPDEIQDQINVTRDLLETLRLVVDGPIDAKFG